MSAGSLTGSYARWRRQQRYGKCCPNWINAAFANLNVSHIWRLDDCNVSRPWISNRSVLGELNLSVSSIISIKMTYYLTILEIICQAFRIVEIYNQCAIFCNLCFPTSKEKFKSDSTALKFWCRASSYCIKLWTFRYEKTILSLLLLANCY